mgnify:CR=1 FL=1
MIKKLSSSDLFAKMRENIKNILHKFLLAIKIVEAKKSQILINSEKNLSMNFVDGLVTNKLDVICKG